MPASSGSITASHLFPFFRRIEDLVSGQETDFWSEQQLQLLAEDLPLEPGRQSAEPLITGFGGNAIGAFADTKALVPGANALAYVHQPVPPIGALQPAERRAAGGDDHNPHQGHQQAGSALDVAMQDVALVANDSDLPWELLAGDDMDAMISAMDEHLLDLPPLPSAALPPAASPSSAF